MSQRKRAAVEAAALAAQEREIPSTKSAQGRWQRLTKPSALATVGLIALLAIGVLGAAVSSAESNGRNENNRTNSSWLGNLFSSAPATKTAAANPALMPTPAPTPQLSKENIYAGGRLLATEDANAPNSTVQPADLVIWRLSTGVWYVKDSTNGAYTINSFGAATTDTAAPGDFDGDGLTDFSVFRPDHTAHTGTWYIQYNPQAGTGNFITAQFGLDTDIPAPADYDGDGRADIAVWRSTPTPASPNPIPPSFFILNSSTNTVQIVNFPGASANDKPAPADFDGDGRADAAITHFDSATNQYVWTIQHSTDNQVETIAWGDTTNGDVPVSGDFDGDGRFDIATRRFSTNEWVVRGGTNISMNLNGFVMQPSDIPVAGDYDGDGKTDAAVWRPSNGTWYIRKSSDGQMRVDAWGQAGDTPIAAPMKR